MDDFKYFSWKEFDCKSGKGKGIDNMNKEFICLLDDARGFADVPFKITSGYRTPEYNKALLEQGYKTSKNSSHTKGLAVDIYAKDSYMKFRIVTALMIVGISRIGIGNNFIHCDMDKEKPHQVLWTYY
jgi:zinc D-Ala-D-Ala carboxypeptidase